VCGSSDINVAKLLIFKLFLCFPEFKRLYIALTLTVSVVVMVICFLIVLHFFMAP
jgi:hypothetical protein